MKMTKFAYATLTITLGLAGALLYAKGLGMKAESFGGGLAYILASVTCFGLAFISGVMTLLEYAGGKICGGKPMYKIAFSVMLALLAAYFGIASLGASGSLSHAIGAVVAVGIAAWFGWLIRDCDEPNVEGNSPTRAAQE